MTSPPTAVYGTDQSKGGKRRNRKRSGWGIVSGLLVGITAIVVMLFGAPAASGQVSAQSMNWNGWSFTYDVPPGFVGLRLTDVRHDDTLLLANASLPVMNVYYENNACGPYTDRLGGTIYGMYTNEFTYNGERWLELGIEDRIGSYVIYQSYYFSESGELDAHMFSKGLQCNIYHEHLPFWRFDFDIEGSDDDQILRRKPDGSLQAMSAEFDADAADAVNHEWFVRDSVSGTTVLVSFDDGTYNQAGTVIPETAYAENNIYGRQYRNATGEITWSGGPTRDLRFNEGETITDAVVWYTGYMPHSAEEGPELWHSTGVRLSIVDDPTVGPPPPGTGECDGLQQEAEAALLSGAMTVMADGSAGGGAYIHAPEGSGNAGSTGGDKAEYCFIVDQAGLYQLSAAVNGLSGSSDSFFVAVDGQPANGYLWDVPSGGGFVTDAVSDRGGDDPVLVDLAAGEHSVVVHLREDGTRLDTLELIRVGDSGGVCGGLTQEAESAALIGTMTAVASGSASGGSYIEAPDGSGNSGSPGSNRAQFCFDVPTSGSYKLSAQVQGSSGLNDSFFVTIDDGPQFFLWDVARNTAGFVADDVSDRTGADPVIVDLSAGRHTITVHLREDGTRLDTLSLVEADPGTGSCSLVQEAEDATLGGAMAAVSSGSASGGAYIEAPNGSGNAGTPGSTTRATFCFDVALAGDYQLSAQVQGDSGTSDSFFVAVDDPAAFHLWDVARSTTGFVADDVADRTGADPVVVNLSAGRHTVFVYLREDGTRLDTLSLVAN